MNPFKPALAAVLALLLPAVLAQEGTILDPSVLPACAFTCANLNAAQQLCVPPVAPPQGQGVYQTCFCTSNYLAPYAAGAASPSCDDTCTSDADKQAILQWYTGLCTGGVVVIPSGNAPNPNVPTTGEGTDDGVTQTTTTTTTGVSSGSTQQSSGKHKSWYVLPRFAYNPANPSLTLRRISTHYQWIIMVIVLLLAGIGFTILGIWLKRRHTRKWATGGHDNDTFLRTHDVTSSLGNRHPHPSTATMSQLHLAAAGTSSRPQTMSKAPHASSKMVS